MGFNPTDEEMVKHLLNKVGGRSSHDAMREVTECDLYGDEGAWRKLFQETRRNCLYFFTKLKKTTSTSASASRFHRATAWCNTWKVQSDKKICMGDKHIASKRCFTLLEKNNDINNPTPTTPRWTMQEFRLDGAYHSLNQGNEYVICRVRRIVSKKVGEKQEESGEMDGPCSSTAGKVTDDQVEMAGQSCEGYCDDQVLDRVRPEDRGDNINEDDDENSSRPGAAHGQQVLGHAQGRLEEERAEDVLLPNLFYADKWVRGWERLD